jgi:hypothetical protein
MMRHNILFDTSPTGDPLHTLRGFWWNLKTLGPYWWAKCAARNAYATLRARPVDVQAALAKYLAVPGRHQMVEQFNPPPSRPTVAEDCRTGRAYR